MLKFAYLHSIMLIYLFISINQIKQWIYKIDQSQKIQVVGHWTCLNAFCIRIGSIRKNFVCLLMCVWRIVE